MSCTRAPSEFRSIIDSVSGGLGLDPDYVEAVVLQEGGNAFWLTNPRTSPGLPEGVYWDGSGYAHGPMAIHFAAAVDAVGYQGGVVFPYAVTDKGTDITYPPGTPLVIFTAIGVAGLINFYSTALADPQVSISLGAQYLARRGLISSSCDPKDHACLAAAYQLGTAKQWADGSWNAQTYVGGVYNHHQCTAETTSPPGWENLRVIPPAPPPGPGQPAPTPGSVGCQDFDPSKELRFLPFPTPSSPYFAYFSITLFGPALIENALGVMEWNPSSKILTPDRPQYITYFEFTERSSGISECVIRVFDPNWDLAGAVIPGASPPAPVQPPLLPPDEDIGFVPAGFQTAEISFGYVHQTATASGPIEPPLLPPEAAFWSPSYCMFLTSYHPEFLGWGVEVEMKFMGPEMISHLKPRTKTRGGKAIALADEAGQSLIWDMADEDGMQACMETTVRVRDNSGATSAGEDDKSWFQDGIGNYDMMCRMTDHAAMFSRQTQVQLESGESSQYPDGGVAVPAQGAYQVFVDSSTRDPEKPERCKPTVHFHPHLLDSPPIREYTYARYGAGAVISFKPDVMAAAIAALGGLNAFNRSMDPVTKEIAEAVYNIDVVKVTNPDGSLDETQGALSTGSHVETAGPERFPDNIMDVEKIGRIYPSSHTGFQNLMVEGVNFFQKARDFSNVAELVVLGDPLIRPMRNITVTVLTFREDKSGGPPLPRVHFTSGVWNVKEVRHIIQGGEYITMLGLFRNDAYLGDAVGGDSKSAVFFNANANNIP
jgi:hypothetical protein